MPCLSLDSIFISLRPAALPPCPRHTRPSANPADREYPSLSATTGGSAPIFRSEVAFASIVPGSCPISSSRISTVRLREDNKMKCEWQELGRSILLLIDQTKRQTPTYTEPSKWAVLVYWSESDIDAGHSRECFVSYLLWQSGKNQRRLLNFWMSWKITTWGCNGVQIRSCGGTELQWTIAGMAYRWQDPR